MRRLPQTATTAYQEHRSADPDWRKAELYDDLAGQYDRLGSTFGLIAEYHRSESRRKTKRGPERELLTSPANPNR